MKLTPKDIKQLEKVCKGLKSDLVKSIISSYYKEKMAKLNRSTRKKSFSSKELNQLSQSKEIRDLLHSISIKEG